MCFKSQVILENQSSTSTLCWILSPCGYAAPPPQLRRGGDHSEDGDRALLTCCSGVLSDFIAVVLVYHDESALALPL